MTLPIPDRRMRPALALLAALSIGLATAAAPCRAQPYVGADGFGLCPLSNSALGMMHTVIGPCQPLTDQAMARFGLSADQAGIVALLRDFLAKPGPDLLQQMADAKSLTPPKQFAAAGEYSDYWFPALADPRNVELGIHLRYIKEGGKQDLYQMTYAADGADGHFTVLWNRSAVTSPSR